MHSIRWKIYYSDGTTFSDQDGDPAQAPPWGIQVIAQRHPHIGRFLIHGTDYYWYEEPRWYGGDLPGCYDYLLRMGALEPTHLGGFTHAWVEQGLLHQGDMLALIKYLARSGLVKFGRYIPSEDFKAIFDRATSDQDLPPKSARHWLEKRGPNGTT